MNKESESLHSAMTTCHYLDKCVLIVSLKSQQLKITVINYQQKIIYQRIYNDNDIGKDIHKKLQLIDIYSCFDNVKLQIQQIDHSDKNKNYQIQCERDYLQDFYKNKKQENQRILFRLDKQGIIKTFSIVKYVRKNKQIEEIYQSNLILNKKFYLSEYELHQQISFYENKRVNEQYQKRIKNLQNENESLKQKVSKLQKDNKDIYEILSKLKSAYELKESLYKRQQQQKTIQLNNLPPIPPLKLPYPYFANQAQKLLPPPPIYFEQEHDYFNCYFKMQEVPVFPIQKYINMQPNLPLLPPPPPIQTSISLPLPSLPNFYEQKNQSIFLNFQSPYVDDFKVQNNTITYIGQGNKFTQCFINELIPKNNIYQFKVKITKSQWGSIMIGIIDQLQQISARSSYISENAYVYNGCGGVKYPLGTKEGKGFLQGDIVQTVVNLSERTIDWYVNDIKQAHYQWSQRHEQQKQYRSYVPYIEFYLTGESVEWIQSSLGAFSQQIYL